MRNAILPITAVLCAGLAAQQQPAGKPVPPRAPAAKIAPEDLRVEYLRNPLGLEAAAPRFSWILSSAERNQVQSAYQILVAASEPALKAGAADKWDSGKIASDASVNVAYEGKSLSSGQTAYWKVRVWDRDGNSSAWSAAANFEMGLLKKSDWQGQWIARRAEPESAPGAARERRPPQVPAPLLRKTFEIPNPVRRARIYVAAMGWYELYLDGRKVGDHVLDPAMTNYDKRVLYVTHDVTFRLSKGRHAIGIMLGNGYYSQPERQRYGKLPKVLVQMNVEYADGGRESIVSDPTWRTADGPVLRNSVQGGEAYDARLEIPNWAQPDFDDSSWDPVYTAPLDGRVLQSQVMPAIKVMRTKAPVRLTNPKRGVYVYDFGQTFTGWTRLGMKGPKGATVALMYSERLWAHSGQVDKTNHPVPAQTDYYTLKGDPAGETYEPRFTFHPFRYLQVEGFPGTPTLGDIEGKVARSAVERSVQFTSSNALLNKIHDMTFWTIENALYGMFMDEPHREPFAYLEPGETPANLYSRFFMPMLWTKWLTDVQDEQTATGDIPVCIPNYPRHKAFDAAWSGNYPVAVWFLYQYYNDRRLLAAHYDSMRRWLEYLNTVAGSGRIMRKGTWGDHMLAGIHPGEDRYLSNETPPELVWTGYYYLNADLVARAARALGKDDDARTYAGLAEDIKTAFNRTWLNAETSQYASGSQTGNLFALALGVVPEANRRAVAANVARDIKEKYSGHLHVGHLGVASMMEALVDNGLGELLYGVVNQPTYPGWGYMVNQGGTTIWEAWSRFMEWPRRGESMSMFGTVMEFFYGGLAGIKGPSCFGPRFMEPGFKHARIEPLIPKNLQHARASVKTVAGTIASSWSKVKGALVLKVTIPVNTRATVSVPKAATIQEGGRTLWKNGAFVGGVPGVLKAAAGTETIDIETGSGTYVFTANGAAP